MNGHDGPQDAGQFGEAAWAQALDAEVDSGYLGQAFGDLFGPSQVAVGPPAAEGVEVASDLVQKAVAGPGVRGGYGWVEKLSWFVS